MAESARKIKRIIKKSEPQRESAEIIALRPSRPRPEISFKADSEALSRNFIKRNQAENVFEQAYNDGIALLPPYDFPVLYQMKENSDSLIACIDAMKYNIEGFGYDIIWVGSNPDEQKSPKSQAEYIKLFDFFDSINEEEGYTKIAVKKREDLETTGCAAFEVIRARNKEIFAMYHAPIMHIRLAVYNKDIDEPVDVTIPIRRDGTVKYVKFKKYFRRFCQILPTTRKVRYFKELGDPRIMDYDTGAFVKTTDKKATELMFFTLPFGGESAYSVPRWSGAVCDVMGRSGASFINYDLMDNQGIPPMAVMISGGVLTEESYKDLLAIMTSAKLKANFNKVIVLEAIPEITGLDEKSNVKLDFKNLSEYRKEDQMFGNYQETALQNIRRPFRLAPLYTGDAKSYNLASARSSQLIAEQQIFIPERNMVDEEINRLIIQREFGIYNWEFRSKGARVVGSEELANAVEKFSNVGSLTINDNIKIANEAFGLNMPIHNEPWANLPVVLLKTRVEQFIQQGQNLGELSTEPAEVIPEEIDTSETSL